MPLRQLGISRGRDLTSLINYPLAKLLYVITAYVGVCLHALLSLSLLSAPPTYLNIKDLESLPLTILEKSEDNASNNTRYITTVSPAPAPQGKGRKKKKRRIAIPLVSLQCLAINVLVTSKLENRAEKEKRWNIIVKKFNRT